MSPKDASERSEDHNFLMGVIWIGDVGGVTIISPLRDAVPAPNLRTHPRLWAASAFKLLAWKFRHRSHLCPFLGMGAVYLDDK